MSRSEYVRTILLRTTITLVAASFLLYALTHIIPGDPIRALFGFRPPPPEQLAELRERHGLDDPFHIQYLKFLGNAVRLDFGLSTSGAPVRDLVVGGLPISLRLIGLALIFQTIVGVGVGLVASVTRRSFYRWLIGATTIMVLAMPTLVIAYTLQTYVGFDLRLLPISGVTRGWTSYLLPALALAAGATALTIRATANEFRTTRTLPFVAAARGRGLTHRRILSIHVFRATLPPIVTLIAASAAQIVGGLIIVETIFEIPGVGTVVVDAIRMKDHNVIVAVLTLAVILSIAANAVADLLHPVIDPRVRNTGVAGSS